MSNRDATHQPRRLVPQLPLPAYSYVTGRFPHPTRDPAGHSFGHAAPEPSPLAAERWRESREYLFGCDLFNFGYYWEAHEVWEGLWKACGRKGATADFLKGLIKLAAAGVKVREGRPEGVRRHAGRAVALFNGVCREVSGSQYLGFDVGWLVALVERLEQHVIAPVSHDAAVEIVFDFQLVPNNSA